MTLRSRPIEDVSSDEDTDDDAVVVYPHEEIRDENHVLADPVLADPFLADSVSEENEPDQDISADQDIPAAVPEVQERDILAVETELEVEETECPMSFIDQNLSSFW